ncbi:MAG: NAD(P)H-hydrate dehydratase [Acidobacteria bacterium]|nr:NAD(P)H-hydrate dehydratase [Acidobacteriota bacterium]
MQKVLTAAEMREVDRLTTEKYGVPSVILMENAAHAVVRTITEKLGGGVNGKSALVLCGKGNNGGDGAAIARILWQMGAKVDVLVWGEAPTGEGDAAGNFAILSRLKGYIGFEQIQNKDQLSETWQNYRSEKKFDVIVDAVFGTGLDRPLTDEYFSFLDIARDRKLDSHRPLIVAVDIPSGLNADGGEPSACPLEADVTVTFTAPKIATVLPPAAHACGEVVVEAIGSPPELIAGAGSRLFVAEENDVASWLWNSRFSDNSYKNKRGHALVIAGSENYSGAAVLSGNAAMRSGAGLVTIGTPRTSKDTITARVLPEVMVRPLAETESGSVSEEAIAEAEALLKNVDAVAIGSGLSTNESTGRFVRHLVEHRHMPTILDADALTLLSPFAEWLSKAGTQNGEGQSLILTPHEGEFLRMLGTKDKELIKDRVGAVREFSQKFNVILVLKGERVLIGEPGGKVVINPSGNSGLGKAGNGDTLTGIIAGFAAQAAAMRIDMFETVVAAVYAAGLAGDIAEKKFGKRVMTASDVRECLTETFEAFGHNFCE